MAVLLEADQLAKLEFGVKFFTPAPRLKDLVTSYYVVTTPFALMDNLHPEWANIRFSLFGRWWAEDVPNSNEGAPIEVGLFGPTDRTRRFQSEGGVLLGIGLTPLGWASLIGGDASLLANRVVDLGARLGPDGDEIVTRLRALESEARVVLLNDVLAQRLADKGPAPPLAEQAHSLIVGGEIDDVGELAGRLGIKERSLNRLCLRLFGFGPKRLLRRQRFLRTLGMVRDKLDRPLTEIIDPAYYDQAHFIKEFRAHMGMSPTAYFSSPREMMRRAAEARQQVIGAPVQGLHQPM